jgi:hypothetical protein
VHPALTSWRDEVRSVFVRALAIFCGLLALSLFCAWAVQSPKPIEPVNPVHHSDWINVDRPFPAFALSIPEAAGAPSTYAIRRHTGGGGRKDILSLGEPDGAGPYLEIEIYRPGAESERFDDPANEIAARAIALSPRGMRDEEPLETKFGPLSLLSFITDAGTPRRCLAFVRAYGDPRLQMTGWFCQGGENFIERSTLACALDRFTLLAAGSEPKVGALFASAELHRTFCGQRSPLLAPTPKHRALWKAVQR